MNRQPSKQPENPHSFLKIGVRYFWEFKEANELEAVNLLSRKIFNCMIVNNQYLKVSLFLFINKCPQLILFTSQCHSKLLFNLKY